MWKVNLGGICLTAVVCCCCMRILIVCNAAEGVDSFEIKREERTLQFFAKATASPVPFTPSTKPSIPPTTKPSISKMPSNTPTFGPSNNPTSFPSMEPTSFPSVVPTISMAPSMRPSRIPSSDPSMMPSSIPSYVPSDIPSSVPSISSPPTTSPRPTSIPSIHPTQIPSGQPSIYPTMLPSSHPSTLPSALPSSIPSSPPTARPSPSPSSAPTISSEPSSFPSDIPSSLPSESFMPSNMPTDIPTLLPSDMPTAFPTFAPSAQPTTSPSLSPSIMPSSNPTTTPSLRPSSKPSIPTSIPPTTINNLGQLPTLAPKIPPLTTTTPTSSPTSAPTTISPTQTNAIPVPITPEPTPTLPNGWIGCTEDGGDQTRYDICLDIQETDPTADPSWIDILILAKQRWEQVIIGDIEGGVVPSSPQLPVCTQLPAYIDDLYLCAMDPPLDGPGGVLAAGGPVLRRRQSDIPIVGIMIFDRDDVDISMSRGTFYNTALHEMGHVFGVGVLWDNKQLIQVVVDQENESTTLFTQQYYVENTIASTEWHNLGCTQRLPIEMDHGQGTAGSHWDEECLDSELMTGVSEQKKQEEKLSKITIGTLQDLGYEVNMTVADEYTIDNVNKECCLGSSSSSSEQSRRRNQERKRKRQRRKLSVRGLKEATEFGRREMKKMNHWISQQQQQQEENEDDELYVSMSYYSVLYQEEDHVYSVIVQP